MLISQIERFLNATNMPRTTFGRLAAGDPRFVEDLRNGREPREAMTRRIEAFMSGYRTTGEETAHAR
ncbi:hypothetical protein MTR62_00415 [Novosphingobium sp. 1949]|uniref:XRE family transcriptional regulator n=1 Tax=Novosphingobium organovorum TaxID=2930092 RepID=A0ABT0B862_9SPHN|nr:hypothetical protein [Novosphingobium organovorum]MCJ2181178.1 hypothetical protein [Novosphingobium organovorum]